MAIDTSKLVAADMLQDYFVDKDNGGPLAGGIITLYEDTQRQTLKNWYYLTGIPGAYTWTALDNPMILSSVGTIQDPQGNDVIPYYYPWDENDSNVMQQYYITVTNYNGVPQFTREDFPPNQGSGVGPSPAVTTTILKNLIVNDEYYRNGAENSSTNTIDVSNVLNKIVSPSQHENFNILQDGPVSATATVPASTDPIIYGDSDVRFMQDIAGDTTTITFTSTSGFTLTSTSPALTQTPVPEYALDINCTVAGNATKKFIQYPIATHLAALSQQQFTYLIWFYNPGGGNSNQVIITNYASFGSGTTGGSPSMTPKYQETVLQTANITASASTFQLVTGTGTFLNTNVVGFSLGDGADDANYLRIYFPVGSSGVMQLRHTKPQVYLTNNIIPTNEFQPYDYLNSLMNSPRTGDVRISNNSYYFYGWLPMNNGTIGFTNSQANLRKNADTWQLYNLLWNINQYNQGFAPLFNTSGAWVLYGSTAYADFSAGNAIGLPRALGNVLAGTTPVKSTGQTFTANHTTSVLTISDSSTFGSGTPVQLYNVGGALPAGLLENVIYYTRLLTFSTFNFIYLYTYYNTSSSTPLVDYYNFIQRPQVFGASTGSMTATYNNGPNNDGIGATLTITVANFSAGMDGAGSIPTATGTRVLIKNQASAYENGIYQVTTLGTGATNWVLTRTVDADSQATLLYGTWVYVSFGATLAGSSWYLNDSVYIIGSSGNDITYAQLTFSVATFSDDGSGTNYIQAYPFPCGDWEGQRYHQLIQSELTDPLTSTAGIYVVSNGSGNNVVRADIAAPNTGAINNTGGNTPHYNMQPTLYQNFYIKL